MGNYKLAEMAKETLQIAKQGFYYLDGKKILLTKNNGMYDYDDVTVLDEDKLNEIEDDEDEFFERYFYATSGANFFLVDGDSYQVAYEFEHPLVMNFANAIHPGGGFLNGARAQEESLCRNSTLYLSLASDKAKEMYSYNRNSLNPLDSDYMLITPDVCVFRDLHGELLHEPYNVSVVTIPAPNKNGRAKGIEQSTLDEVMIYRLRRMLLMAARYGYRNLVLGAWGCGAFGHDAETVAGYFYKLFFEERFDEFFDNVAFAILHDEDKIYAFRKVFGDKVEDCTGMEQFTTDENSTYYEAICGFPICNHTERVSKENVGYVQGIMKNGVPFEAELWENDDGRNISIVMPELFINLDRESKSLQKDNLIGFHNQVEAVHNGVLTIGMVDGGVCTELDVTMQYVDYLKENGIIEFVGGMENGSVFYVTDVEGKDLVYVTVTLTEQDKTYAKTALCFRNFPNQFHKRTITVVK